MKLNKSNPKHVSIIALTGIYILIGLLLRPLIKKRSDKNTVIFFGHTLNGNLKAFYDFLAINKETSYQVFFLGINKSYTKRLERSGLANCLLTTRLTDMLKLAKADVVISSHGIHLLSAYRRLTNMKFVDVWHGIPYKGFDEEDFRGIHDHDQIWVSSESLREMYIDKFGFLPEKVKVTGYCRVDQLIDGSLNKELLISKYNIPKAEKYILLAPTWQQDVKSRSLVPFGVSNKKFFTEIDTIASKHNAKVIFRTHLNSGSEIDISDLNSTVFMPYADYELAEEFLVIADILISDWSSIAFDFLPLKRPTIFLDVEAPFKKGFSLGPEHRFGEVVDNFSKLKKAIDKYLSSPNAYLEEHSETIEETEEVAYGNTLDGNSCERSERLLSKLLKD